MPCCQSTLHGRSKQFQRFQPEVDAFKYAFLPRTVPAWNALPREVVNANSLNQFKWLLVQPDQLWSYIPHVDYVYMFLFCTIVFLRHWWSRGHNSSTISFGGHCYIYIQTHSRSRTGTPIGFLAASYAMQVMAWCVQPPSAYSQCQVDIAMATPTPASLARLAGIG